MTRRALLPHIQRPSAAKRLLANQHGQAMVEYASITGAFAVVVGLPALAIVLPQLLNAINTYLNSVYFVLNLPLP